MEKAAIIVGFLNSFPSVISKQTKYSKDIDN